MRRSVPSLASIVLAMVVAMASNLARASCPTLHDVQDMIAAGFSSRTIREVFAESQWNACLSAEDLEHLRRSGLSEDVVTYLEQRAQVAAPSPAVDAPVGYASAIRTAGGTHTATGAEVSSGGAVAIIITTTTMATSSLTIGAGITTTVTSPDGTMGSTIHPRRTMYTRTLGDIAASAAGTSVTADMVAATPVTADIERGRETLRSGSAQLPRFARGYF